MVHNLVWETTKRSLKTTLTCIIFERVGIMIFVGGITLQLVESSRTKVCIWSVTMATVSGPCLFVPMAALRFHLSRDIFWQIWRASKRTLSQLLVLWSNNGRFFMMDCIIVTSGFVRGSSMHCCLNNSMLDPMERNGVRVGRGAPIGNDGIWLVGQEHCCNWSQWCVTIVAVSKETLIIGKESSHFT